MMYSIILKHLIKILGSEVQIDRTLHECKAKYTNQIGNW